VSLILEALRKLERDRHTHERGFLVLAQPAWTPAGERAWTRGPALLGVAALAGGAVAAALLWPARPEPAPMPATAALPASAPVTPSAATAPPDARPLPAAPKPAPRARVAWPEDRAPAPKTAAPATATPRERTPVQAEPAQTDVAVADAEEPAPEAPEAPEVSEAATVTGPLRLEAIAERDGQPVAVVSGQMVRVGDRIGAGTVVRIGTSDIEIETDGRRQVLRF
jgi:hypothetical protein